MKHISILIPIFLLTSLVFSPSPSVQAQYLETKRDRDKAAVQSQLNNITQEQQRILADYNNVSSQKNSLKEQVKAVNDEMAKLDGVITECRLAVSKLEQLIDENTKQIQDLQKEKRNLVIEIQKEAKVSDIERVLSSKSLSEAMIRLYSSSALVDRIEKLDQKIKALNDELEKNKQQKEECIKTSEEAKTLQKSKADGLKILLEQTEGQESKYQELLDGLKTQAKEREAQISSIDKAYQEALIRDQQNSVTSNSGGSGNSGGSTSSNSNYTPGPSGCRFEDGGDLGVGKGYFRSPTSGAITQLFHCGHDGVDVANGEGTSLYAVADGVVVKRGSSVGSRCAGFGCNAGFGNYVVVRITVPSGKRVYAMYAHMASPSPFSEGSTVSKGDIVGKMGCTGYTIPYPCGVHLHFMMISQSYESTNDLGCLYGSTKCYNPSRYINF
jgi:murein DD-endopeptidase MepM/ murein hydrolase activator NlpD